MRQAALPVVLFLGLLAACGGEAAGTDDAPDDGGADGVPDASPSDAEPAVCGRGAGERGLQRHTVDIDGRPRSFLVYLPPAVSASERLPLVYVHHGYTMSGQLMVDITEYTQLADEEGIAIAFPDGQGGGNSTGAPWNVGTGLCPSFLGPPPNAPGNDFALLDAMRATISEQQCLDADHVFATGFSMGGYFAHHAACEYPGLAGAAPHSGGTHDLDQCTAGVRPIIIFHGDADNVIPAGCSDPHAIPVAGTTASADAWAAHNGCSLESTANAVDGGTCHVYEGCPPGGQVELCTFRAMGHCWAGGAASAGIYSCPAVESATRLQWEFFKAHAW